MPHPGLDTLARGRECLSEYLVELLVEIDEFLRNVVLHNRIIRALIPALHLPMTKDVQAWIRKQQHTPEMLRMARLVLDEISHGRDVFTAVRHHPLSRGGYIPKHALIEAYHQMVAAGELSPNLELLSSLRMKPVRTLSGVTTVTVLTKPYECPGHCIFCPTELQMPKSYLADEPGASRAVQNEFDPYRQVKSRLESYRAVGHPIDKIELLILGGTWSVYPKAYKEDFIKRCLDALNDRDSATLAEAQTLNENALSRNVGLVIETRPEYITTTELQHLRHMGVTKVQLGAQSLDDDILRRNQRGHTAADTLRATALLRAAGFKIVLHWMPNLLGATLSSDHIDFMHLWSDGYCPDELKIYPTQLLETAELYTYWKNGEYHPYSTSELISLLADLKPAIPPYCRVNRVIRDIPSTHIIAGNKRTSLRQDILAEIARRGQTCGCIRCHEVKNLSVSVDHLLMEDFDYPASYAWEHFLTHRTQSNRIASYLRLSLPQTGHALGISDGFPDLEGAAIIREVHVYGQALPVGGEKSGAAQHIGLGTQLIAKAEEISRQAGFKRLAVISAIGTRLYYESRSFARGDLYHVKSLE